jgi:MFS family permease
MQPSGKPAGGIRALRWPTALRPPIARLHALRTPWYWGWNILAVSLLFQAVTWAVPFSCFTFYAEKWVTEFGVARSHIMLAMTIPAFVGAGLGPFVGRAIDTMSLRALVAFGIVAFSAGLALLSMVTAVWQVTVLYSTILAFGFSFAGNLTAQVLAARWFPKRRGLAIGLTSTGISLGSIVIPPTVVWMIGEYGWRHTLDLLAIGTLALVLPLVLTVIRNNPAPHEVATDKDPTAATAPEEKVFTTRMILRERNFWALCLIIIPIVACLGGFQANLAAYAAERGFTPMQGGTLFSLMASMLLVAKFLWGHLADRVEHRLLFGLASILSALAFVALAFASGFVGVSASAMFLGIAMGGVLPLMGASFSYTFGRSFGRAFGLMAPFMPLSSMGPPGVAWLQERTHSYTASLLVLGAVVLCSALAALLLRTYRR